MTMVSAESSLPPSHGSFPELFELGRAADALARATHDRRGTFTAARRLLGDRTWQGPSDAGLRYFEEQDLAAIGDLDRACSEGANAVLAQSLSLAAQASRRGLRSLLRLDTGPGIKGEDVSQRLAALADELRTARFVDGLVPSADEAGLATLVLVARTRLALREVPHVLVDLTRLGHKLGQLCLGFGADEMFGPIVDQRALRLGANVASLDLTRTEAARLMRGAGWRPCERGLDGELREIAP